ncbi:hypothetical protein E2C01_012801 [Portunus trituberculatus]|uniref:Uncharacterized protein n=1 Tax=Portunus trituberculatus TaxID=210409 RepID=A0A5B7DEU6_PORTR|nr:hypothetical protein [Portunus trituberculatus]
MGSHEERGRVNSNKSSCVVGRLGRKAVWRPGRQEAASEEEGVARSAAVPGSAAPQPLPDLQVRILVAFRWEAHGGA